MKNQKEVMEVSKEEWEAELKRVRELREEEQVCKFGFYYMIDIIRDIRKELDSENVARAIFKLGQMYNEILHNKEYFNEE